MANVSLGFTPMWERTGRVVGNATEALLYTLLRDGDVEPGRLEKVLGEVEEASMLGTREFRLSNGFLGGYAKDVAARLDALRRATPRE